MSIWKEKSVKIIQIVPLNTISSSICGLGNDNCIYTWEYKEGSWKKYWNQEDKPEGESSNG